ncbi:Hypothetical predicted protein, partial [Mytilus galloprovincialis]
IVLKNEIKSTKEQRQKQDYLNDDLNKKLKELQERTRQYQLENNQTEERYQLVCKEKDDLKLRLQQAFDQLNQKDKAKTDLEKMNLHQKHTIIDKEEVITVLRKEKDDLQTRLSSVAGEKLTKGNPAITDLGDPDRPMKIGEKYGELYDNEWTDAMENIKTVKQYYHGLKDSEIEEIIIHHLHRLLKCCYYDCLDRSDQQIRSLGKAFAETMCMSLTSDEDFVNLPVCKEASAFRKDKSKEFANVLYQNKSLCKNAIDDWKYKFKNINVMQLLLTSEFFEKCVHLCWSMVIQDPKMYLDEDLTPNTPFDKNTYKEFVRSGDRVAYVVWPALFLHKDGPLLFKGVVQAYWKKS